MLYRELHRDGVLLPLFREFMQRPSEHVNIPEATHLIDQWITPEKRRRNASELQMYGKCGPVGLGRGSCVGRCRIRLLEWSSMSGVD